MGKASRDKGKRGEREVAKIIRDSGLDDTAVRGVQHKGGPNSPDVLTTLPVHIEVKRTETLQLHPAMDQAIEDAAEDKMPVVVHRRSGEEWIAVLKFDDLLNMLKTAKGEQ